MGVFPFLHLLFLSFNLVLSVGNDIQKLKCSHLPHIIPWTSAGLADCIYIGDPSPLVVKRLI